MSPSPADFEGLTDSSEALEAIRVEKKYDEKVCVIAFNDSLS